MDAPKSLTTSLKMEAARNRLLAWRRTRPPYGRIPDEIWDEAAGLVDQFGLATVARTLGLDYTQLKKRSSARQVAVATPAPFSSPSFVELPGAQFFKGPVPAEMVVEVSNPAGSRLTLRLPAQGVDITGLVQAFCGYGGRG